MNLVTGKSGTYKPDAVDGDYHGGMSDARNRTHYQPAGARVGPLTRVLRKLPTVKIEPTKVEPNWCYRDDRNNEFVFVPHVRAHDRIRPKPGLFVRILERLKFWPGPNHSEIPEFLRHQKD